jgi:hypothetical protein
MRCKAKAKGLYLELTTLLIDLEIAKFRSGEQAASVTLRNVAKLARNARKEITPPSAPAHRTRDASAAVDLHQRNSIPPEDEGVCENGQSRQH